MERQTDRTGLALGLIFITIGALLLLRGFNFFTPFIFLHSLLSWKLVLVIIGLILFFISGNRSAGIVLMVVGGILLIPDILDISFFRMWRIGLPLVLITAGVIIIAQKNNGFRSHPSTEEKIETGYIDEVIILGGSKKNISTAVFNGGKCTVIFGGSEINLMDSELAEGQNVLNITAIFGGITVYVPVHWPVRAEIDSVLGGFSDTRPLSGFAAQQSPGELIIRGQVIFGGGEIKTAKF